MGQRLGLASALLGDPRTLILNELDPDGVLWVLQRLVVLGAHLPGAVWLETDRTGTPAPHAHATG
jgi:hypothetical protein